jgi:predicted CoA-binding protein
MPQNTQSLLARMKKTLILGATPFKDKYAYMATAKLAKAGHEVVPVGIRTGEIEGHVIIQGTPTVENVDTVTLYLNPERQAPLYDYILSLKPNRIIFNPGTENPELAQLAQDQKIETVEGCTLVMLSIGVY